METFGSYMMKQSRISNSALKKRDTANRILNNLLVLNANPDGRVRIQDDYEISCTNPVHGEKSPDPVYRTLSRAKRLSHEKPRFSFTGLEGALDDMFTYLQTKMEDRTMTQIEYEYILKTSTNSLILEKIKILNTKYDKASA
ncbi:MAG: hypothetical protein AABW67_06100 [Nanoarchaeota archaeon]